MGSKFSLHGDMIPRSVKRLIDTRGEERLAPTKEQAVLDFRCKQHKVAVINLSSGGAMIAFDKIPNIGEQVTLHLMGHTPATAFVRWIKGGRLGLHFRTAPQALQ
jgi:hypothetical protein